MKLAASVAVVAMIAAFVSGCTDQQVARRFGGKARIDLPAGRRLVTITWKDEDSLWYLTRPMVAGEQPTTYRFSESSSFGLVEGVVDILEH